ncbi:MAG: peptide synthetase [Rhodospirillaceae bacterium]|nr:peptide synthetase [Rhodospirillaceae bacterium]|tara:strand:- start:3802 stop:4386 length:585 start_codon:yes stop_codon:yes gene_type:complete
MRVSPRKTHVSCETTYVDGGKKAEIPSRKAVAIAVIENPFANKFHKRLTQLENIGEWLGKYLGELAVNAMNAAPSEIESFGKAAIVGENGELEHAAAILHPKLGQPLREVMGGGRALVPSAKKLGGPGIRIDVPLGHKNAAYVRSHFDSIEAGLPDAPRANEILVCVAVADFGRPHARVGGLKKEDVVGKDGLK